MIELSTHVLDVAAGTAGVGVAYELSVRRGDSWVSVTAGVTDRNGRAPDLTSLGAGATAGTYRLTFDLGSYFESKGIIDYLHPVADVTFIVKDEQNCHVPLLVTPFSYTTYRGT